jgi:hypothetical protein
MRLIFMFEDGAVEAEEVACALEAGSEEAEMHARREPGVGAGTCGDKYCTHASHTRMLARAMLLEEMADQLRDHL